MKDSMPRQPNLRQDMDYTNNISTDRHTTHDNISGNNQLGSKQRQMILNKNPTLLRRLMDYNKLNQQIQLLQFINMEQSIMNQDLVHIRIPELTMQIGQIKQQIQHKSSAITGKTSQISQLKLRIQQYKGKILNKCTSNISKTNANKLLLREICKLRQHRQYSQISQSMSTNMDKLNIINKGKIKHKPLNLNNRQEENKENMNGQNGHLQVNPNERQQEQLVIKKIKMKTQNKVLQDKIRLMKEEIKKKMNMLQDAKQQTKRAKQQLTRGCSNSRRTATNSKSRSIAASQYNSIIVSEHSSHKPMGNEQ